MDVLHPQHVAHVQISGLRQPSVVTAAESAPQAHVVPRHNAVLLQEHKEIMRIALQSSDPQNQRQHNLVDLLPRQVLELRKTIGQKRVTRSGQQRELPKRPEQKRNAVRQEIQKPLAERNAVAIVPGTQEIAVLAEVRTS